MQLEHHEGKYNDCKSLRYKSPDHPNGLFHVHYPNEHPNQLSSLSIDQDTASSNIVWLM